MHLIDLHCDTLYKSVTENISFTDKNLECQLMDINSNSHKLQFYAIWIPDNLTGDEAEELFYKAHKRLLSECKQNNIALLRVKDSVSESLEFNHNLAIFTIENGLALNGKLENVRKFAELGVRMITLTWNDHNDIGDGAEVSNAKGITNFGKKVVAEMENNSIIVDVSHASDRLFYDVAEITTKPFVASHSNSRSITEHRRNLTDEQFKIICSRGGIVGINFHTAFLNNDCDKACMEDVLRHTEHFLSLGGENVLSIGSDFDGCVLPKNIKGSSSVVEIYEMFLKKGYKEELVQKIFFKNALNFVENFDI